MAGLLEQQAPMDQQPQQPKQPQQGGSRKATKAEQEQFNLIVKQAIGFITQQEQMAQFLDMLDKVEAPMAIAQTVKVVLDGVFTAAQSAGAQVDPNTMTAAAFQVASTLVSMMVNAGAQVDPSQLVNAAMQQMEGL